jgi:AraC family transcriptional regulator, regulatory protein of adaptative response / DNA-3-methyladenine glycosylase II
VRTELPVDPALDVDGVLDFLRVRHVPGVEAVGDAGGPRWYARALRVPDPVVLRATLDGGVVAVETWDADATAHTEVVTRVGRLFGLDVDPGAADAALQTDPVIAPLVAARPGIRIPRALDPSEALIRAVVGQQISVAAARLTMTELAVTGEPIASPVPGVDRLAPTPARLADGGAELLRGPESRRRTLRETAAALASGELVLDPDADRDELGARMLAMRGIGPWTVGYVRMFGFGDPDMLLTGDSALRLGARRIGIDDSPAALVERAEALRPWRSYLGLHLWRAAALKV